MGSVRLARLSLPTQCPARNGVLCLEFSGGTSCHNAGRARQMTRRQARITPHCVEDCASCPLPGTAWSLQGHSRAGERTGFWIPELRVFLDAGVNTTKRPLCVLVTHSHADHSFNVPCIAVFGYKPELRPLLYVPASMEAPLRHACRAAVSLNYCSDPPVDYEVVNVKPVAHGDCFDLVGDEGRPMNVRVRVFDCKHGVPCVGYALSTTTRKLKPELQGLSGKAIAELRRTGVTVVRATEACSAGEGAGSNAMRRPV